MSTLGKSIVIILLVSILSAACTSQPSASLVPVPGRSDNPFAPQSGDGSLMRGEAEIVSASVLTTESLPLQVSISLAYRLPTPCYQPRVSQNQPDSQNRIQLDVYGVAIKDKPCTLMALSTPQEASISLGSFAAGQYSVWINGVQIGEFTAK
jgi:hypothetical protein